MMPRNFILSQRDVVSVVLSEGGSAISLYLIGKQPSPPLALIAVDWPLAPLDEDLGLIFLILFDFITVPSSVLNI